ncbi:hypothetical protein AGR13a_Lc90063 [Agrobacterium genomosp. 13 str. CFBP 6927]|uniref:Uncharacterized protein n=1 Tax=Agrobacterium genomosp. 13 str. CFBP 6927 TaxID=1183428 RepID=A0ABM9VMY7_9HYPH|nr:hypothetical protein AGR13a_Lc90063 [Agrobacterium genomosp. 13 str. CFBP 6927]
MRIAINAPRLADLDIAEPVFARFLLAVFPLVISLQLGDAFKPFCPLFISFALATFGNIFVECGGARFQEAYPVTQIEIVEMRHKGDAVTPSATVAAIKDVLDTIYGKPVFAAAARAGADMLLAAQFDVKPLCSLAY